MCPEEFAENAVVLLSLACVVSLSSSCLCVYPQASECFTGRHIIMLYVNKISLSTSSGLSAISTLPALLGYFGCCYAAAVGGVAVFDLDYGRPQPSYHMYRSYICKRIFRSPLMCLGQNNTCEIAVCVWKYSPVAYSDVPTSTIIRALSSHYIREL